MEIALFVFLGIMLLGAVLAFIFTANSLINLFRYKLPYASTSDWAIDWLGQNLKLPDGAVLIDMGCGDGRVLHRLKKHLPNVTMIGYEQQWWLSLWAKWKSRGTGVQIRRQSFYDADLQNVDVVFCFLIDSIMARVEKLLREKMKPGAVVYSYGFTFPTWNTFDKIVNQKKPNGSKLNIYHVPVRTV